MPSFSGITKTDNYFGSRGSPGLLRKLLGPISSRNTVRCGNSGCNILAVVQQYDIIKDSAVRGAMIGNSKMLLELKSPDERVRPRGADSFKFAVIEKKLIPKRFSAWRRPADRTVEKLGCSRSLPADYSWLNRFHESSVWHAASCFFGFGHSGLLRFHCRRRWIGGLELTEPLFFLLGFLFKVSLPLFELIVWFCQFVILLEL